MNSPAVAKPTLPQLADAFRTRLSLIQAAEPTGFPWYPYDSLGNFCHFSKLFGGDDAQLLRLLREGTCIDIGCGDGDLSFFLETLGCKMQAVDHAVTNFNGMRGVHALRKALHSDLGISAADLDTQFELPPGDYGVAFLMGVLYHLKNPFYVLERLSRHARHLLLSTRVMRRVPGLPEPVGHLPVAYFLASDELNLDRTNYWIFTPAALTSLLKRTNWEVIKSISVGETETSDAVSLDRDERMFCYARSRYAMTHLQILSGFHEPEGSGWRWTQQLFSVAAETTGRTVTIKLYISTDMLGSPPRITLSARANGVDLAPATYASEGFHTYIRSIPPSAVTGSVHLDFALDKALEPDDRDRRQRGVILYDIDIA